MIRAILAECHLSVQTVELNFNFDGNSWFMLILGGRTKFLGGGQSLCLETEVTGTSTTTGSPTSPRFRFIQDMKQKHCESFTAALRPRAGPGSGFSLFRSPLGLCGFAGVPST